MRDQLLIDVSHPVLRDHKVHGRHLLPGLGTIDLLYQIFREHGHDPATLVLRNLSIHQPLSVEPGEQVLLTIEWQTMHPDGWQVTIDSGKGRHATARMLRIAPAAFGEKIDLAAVRQSARTTIDAGEIYEGFRGRGLVHSGLMKAQGALYVTDTALYVDVAVSEEALSSADSLLFHPALIDGSAVMAGGLLAPSERRLDVPLFFESFRACATLQRRCMARIEMASVRRRNELSYLSIDFFDESGHKVAELNDLACREIREADWVAIEKRSARPPAGPPRSFEARPASFQDGLRELLADRLGIARDRVRSDRTFAEMGLVSGDLLDLARIVESWVGETLSPALLFEYTTVADLAGFLDGRGRATQTETRTNPAGGEGIAIVGISGRFPQSASVDELWKNLAAGADCITEVPPSRWDHSLVYDASGSVEGKTRCKWGGFIDGVDEFDPLFFNISPAEAKLMDPQARLFLETVWNLLESAGHTRATLQNEYGGRVGVYVGAMYQHYGAAESDPLSQSITSLSSYSAIANRVSYSFGLSGPSIAVDTMCSSSATAIHMACKDLMLGECELAVAGGVNLSIHPKKYVGLSQAQLIASHAGSRSFSEGDGYLPAETVGAVLLKPLSKAVADGDAILAVIRSSAVNHGGRANGYTVPNPNAQAQLIEEVLAKAGVDARTVSYVEAAANGAAAGDWVEIAALCKAFGKFSDDRQYCSIGSVKSNIGHAEAASGISQLAKVVEQMRRGVLVPSIKADPPRLEETPFVLQKEPRDWKRPFVAVGGAAREWPRRAIINSFGAGGAYASMLLEEYVGGEGERAPARLEPPSGGPHAFVFSARTEDRLRAVAARLLAHLEEHGELSLADLAYTLQLRRETMEWRLAIVTADRDELLRGMRAHIDGAGTSVAIVGAVEESRGALPDGAGRDPYALARLWTEGYDVPWQVLHDGCARRILSLPTYPFLRERHWLSSGGALAMPAAQPPAGVEDHAPSADVSIRGTIASFLSRALDIPADQIQPARDLQYYGMDSIVAMRLARALEEKHALRVTGRTLFEHRTIDSLSAHLESRLQSAEPAASDDDVAVELLEQFKRGTVTSSEIEAWIQRGAFL